VTDFAKRYVAAGEAFNTPIQPESCSLLR